MGEENGSQPRETSRETQREALGGQSDAARPWTAFATPLIGKAVRGASRLLRHGGSAFPGKIVEQIDPRFPRPHARRPAVWRGAGVGHER